MKIELSLPFLMVSFSSLHIVIEILVLHSQSATSSELRGEVYEQPPLKFLWEQKIRGQFFKIFLFLSNKHSTPFANS